MTPSHDAATLSRLDEQLATMRRYGQDDLILVGTSLTPELIAWADMNNVGKLEDPDAKMGVLYLVNRAAIEEGIYDTAR